MRLAALGSTVQQAASPTYSSSRSARVRAVRRRVVAGVLVALSVAMIPFPIGAERIARPFQDAYGWVAGFVHAKSENERLKEQLRVMQQRWLQNQTAAQENRELRKALKYKSGPMFPGGYDQIGAQVLSHKPNEFQQKLMISAGRGDDIRTYDPVVDSDGYLVGHVSKTSPDTSQVTLLTDGDFAVAGYDVGTQTQGLVKHGQGAGEALIFDLVPKDELVRRNDLIVTAGRRSDELSSLYPRNIAVGIVTSVNQSDIDIFQTVQVEPLADFSSLSSIWVLIPKDR